jgi:hypothetical protein
LSKKTGSAENFWSKRLSKEERRDSPNGHDNFYEKMKNIVKREMLLKELVPYGKF